VLSPPVVRLAEELGAILPPALQKMMFMSTGSESNEAALRMAKLKTGGFEVVALTGSWHGMTAAASSSTYNGGRAGYGPATAGSMAIPGPNCYRCPIRHCRDTCDMTCLEVGFGLYDSQSVGAPAAVIAEPIQSSAGVIVPPDGYFVRLKAMCEERGLLLVIDEAQTGLGRLGSNFAFEQLGIVPDILTLSKTLGNGVPMAATVTSDEVEEECFEKGFLFYTSHVSDPLPAAVALAVLRVLREENLAERAAEMGRYFMDGLRALQQRYECIGDVRGRGLLIGLEVVKDRETRQPDRPLAHKVQRLCLEMGLVLHAVRADSQSSVRLAPPLTVSKAELDKGIEIMDLAFRRALDS
jgi:2,2-dialkylglycine decarboxylase (pyruvate)